MNIENQDTPEGGNDTQSDNFDMTAATADISSELFGQGDEEDGDAIQPDGKPEGSKPAEGEEQPSTGTESGDVVVPPQTGEETTAEVQEVGAPKTWTKEALESWATIPPRAQQEILKREEDFFRGIGQYKEAAEVGTRYSEVVQPYAPILAAENIDPVQLFQSFAANHYLLTKGTPEQKIELAASMLSGYDIPLPELLNYMADNLAEPVDATVAALQREVAELKAGVNRQTAGEQKVAGDRIAAEIEAFAQDPAHPHFDEVADHIHKLFASGVASTLPEAYEMAVYANPTTRQKEIDRITSERTSALSVEEQKRKDKVARSTADNVTLTPKSRNGTVPAGSIDDTLSETMASISNRA